MAKSPLFDDLGRRLLAAGLPWAYVRRYVGELRGHRRDIVEEGMAAGLDRGAAQLAADERLGRADELARAAVRQFRGRSFLGRHPWLFFGVAPLFVVLLAFMAVAIVFASCGPWLLSVSDPVNWVVRTCTPGLCMGVNYGLPSVMAVLFYDAARRRGMGLGWRVFPCVVIALVATIVTLWVTFAADPHHGTILLMVRPQPGLAGVFTVAATVFFSWMMRRRRFRRAVVVL